ncbi:PilZ domain-containing protein [Rummeliibacillus pycnus]|uniref:PilZ domain-containing protein n=1 Tax=Rummeliibacillus pycnus TaxID=101070 RepID=UPI003D2B96F8
MKFKRKESFRHALERNVTAECKIPSIKEDNEVIVETESCRLVDLSPSGARIAMPVSLPVEDHPLNVELNFVLYAKPICVEGMIKWKRMQGDEFLYGIDLEADEVMMELIISELKLRRRQEVKENL